jgi:hypothetical protein
MKTTLLTGRRRGICIGTVVSYQATVAANQFVEIVGAWASSRIDNAIVTHFRRVAWPL